MGRKFSMCITILGYIFLILISPVLLIIATIAASLFLPGYCIFRLLGDSQFETLASFMGSILFWIFFIFSVLIVMLIIS